MMWQASRQRGTPGAAARPRDLSRLFVATLLLTLVNPLTIVVFTTFAAQLPRDSSASTTVLYALSLFFAPVSSGTRAG
jgi:threonine/homoserine/homoserine lactone efflux protein